MLANIFMLFFGFCLGLIFYQYFLKIPAAFLGPLVSAILGLLGYFFLSAKDRESLRLSRMNTFLNDELQNALERLHSLNKQKDKDETEISNAYRKVFHIANKICTMKLEGMSDEIFNVYKEEISAIVNDEIIKNYYDDRKLKFDEKYYKNIFTVYEKYCK